MKKNSVYRVVGESVSDQGYGITHIDGQTVFVKNLLPDEEADIKIIKAAKSYGVAIVQKRITTSKDRVEPVCKQAGKCGGCSFLHMNYSSELNFKHDELKHLFDQVDSSIDVKPVLGMEKPWNYRNKAQFPIRIKDGKVNSGFYRPHTNEIAPIDHCPIQAVMINEVFVWIIENLSLRDARGLRHLYIREAKTKQMQVVFIGEQENDLKDFARSLQKQFPQIVSVVFNKNTRKDNVILSDEYEILLGKDTITEDCLGLKIELHFKSFYQINPVQMEVLYSKALELANLSKEDHVIELYSGTGTIGLLAARSAGKVTGVEIVPEAVANANENRKANHIENAQFICMDASEFAAKNKNAADVVFVDPPRKGMTTQGIHDICLLEPRRIVYISCNPRTLARDLKDFMNNGYSCKLIQPVDMFAHTTGIECVALIEKTNEPRQLNNKTVE